MPIALKRQGSAVLVRETTLVSLNAEVSLTKTRHNSTKTEVKQNDSVITNNTPVANGNVFTFGLVDQEPTTTNGLEKRSLFSRAKPVLLSPDWRAQIFRIGASLLAFGSKLWRFCSPSFRHCSESWPFDGSHQRRGLHQLGHSCRRSLQHLPELRDFCGGGPPTLRYHTIKWRYRGTQEYKGPSFIDVQNLELFCYMVTDNTTAVRARVDTRVYFTDN